MTFSERSRMWFCINSPILRDTERFPVENKNSRQRCLWVGDREPASSNCDRWTRSRRGTGSFNNSFVEGSDRHVKGRLTIHYHRNHLREINFLVVGSLHRPQFTRQINPAPNDIIKFLLSIAQSIKIKLCSTPLRCCLVLELASPACPSHKEVRQQCRCLENLSAVCNSVTWKIKSFSCRPKKSHREALKA